MTYALEGSIFVAGAAIQWLRDEMKLIANAAESGGRAGGRGHERLLRCPGVHGPWRPYWDQYARGAIVGLTRGCNRAHIVRATLDSLTYQTYDVLNAMRADSGIALASLKVDGGASASNYLMQTQADVIGAPVLRPTCVESTAMGAAYLAGPCGSASGAIRRRSARSGPSTAHSSRSSTRDRATRASTAGIAPSSALSTGQKEG